MVGYNSWGRSLKSWLSVLASALWLAPLDSVVTANPLFDNEVIERPRRC
jgi:hypothetical protein